MSEQSDGCRRLWCAVLQQAIDDIFVGTDRQGLDRVVAMKFLFDKKRISLWRQQREHICYLAGIDPEAFNDAVRRKARKLCAKFAGWDYELAD